MTRGQGPGTRDQGPGDQGPPFRLPPSLALQRSLSPSVGIELTFTLELALTLARPPLLEPPLLIPHPT